MADSSVADLRLINRILKGEEAALSELYVRYGAQVFAIALYVLGEQALAEEATQDTFLKIWHNAGKWDIERGELSTWIKTIARYAAIDVLRREKRQPATVALDLEEMLNLIGISDTPRSGESSEEELLKSLIAQLPSDQVEAIELAFFKGMTHNEIAVHLHQPLGTIKSRIRIGLQVLRGLWLQEMG
ncbi:MAG: sigma-70 family RNA polymerase sigma factor [Chloroflexi bacterium]|nr:sigma-70 family RNA polymerase sigma factor [Chloroflexota bacterium]